MIADAMAVCLMYPLPGDDTEPRRMELRESGKANIAELAAECERNGWKHESLPGGTAVDKLLHAYPLCHCERSVAISSV